MQVDNITTIGAPVTSVSFSLQTERMYQLSCYGLTSNGTAAHEFIFGGSSLHTGVGMEAVQQGMDMSSVAASSLVLNTANSVTQRFGFDMTFFVLADGSVVGRIQTAKEDGSSPFTTRVLTASFRYTGASTSLTIQKVGGVQTFGAGTFKLASVPYTSILETTISSPVSLVDFQQLLTGNDYAVIVTNLSGDNVRRTLQMPHLTNSTPVANYTGAGLSKTISGTLSMATFLGSQPGIILSGSSTAGAESGIVWLHKQSGRYFQNSDFVMLDPTTASYVYGCTAATHDNTSNGIRFSRSGMAAGTFHLVELLS